MMIYVGIDDTDTLDDPGTNQLARHLVRDLAGSYSGRLIIRHQLLEDPRVPCTKKNGCASIAFEPIDAVGWVESDETHQNYGGSRRPSPTNASHRCPDGARRPTLHELIERLRSIIVPWCPKGSDPGLCVTESVPSAVIAFGQRCQRELVTQTEARQLAAEHSIHLEGLGGTEDGVIGALAAVGLMATKNDGRVVHFGSGGEDWYDVTGCLEVSDILSRGIDEVRMIDSGEPLATGTVDVGKRLRPNYRNGKIVLFVTRNDSPHWEAVRLT
jgi:tRNA(Ile2) C34 agmatinyltransferase TiaS